MASLTKKQTKQLRGMANALKPLISIGKNDITDPLVKQASETLEKRELVKFSIQDGSGLTAKEAAENIAGQVGAQVVQTIGNRFTLYRASKRKDIEHIKLVRE